MSMAVHKNIHVKEDVISSSEPRQVPSIADQVKDGKKNKFPGYNLYIKNLDDSFTDATLRESFDRFGTITSAKVMCDSSGQSKGFGFVCFATKEEADEAVLEMNGRIVGTKPLYVAIAQKKEERKQYLSNRYKSLSNDSSNPHIQTPSMTMHPAVQIQEPMPASYVPVNSAINPNVPLRSNYPGVSYVMPVNPALTYMPMSYQPLFLLPNIVQPPFAHMPVLHQPIYLHSSKTNTLIYSTGMQTVPHQMPVPGIQVYTSSPETVENSGVADNAVHTIPTRSMQNHKEAPDPSDDVIDTCLADDIQNKVTLHSD